MVSGTFLSQELLEDLCIEPERRPFDEDSYPERPSLLARASLTECTYMGFEKTRAPNMQPT